MKGTGLEEDDYEVWSGVLGGPGIFEIVERINRLWDYYPLAEGSPGHFQELFLEMGQFLLDARPYQVPVDVKVTMGNDISHSCDASPVDIRMFFDKFGGQVLRSIPNHLDIPEYCIPRPLIMQELFEGDVVSILLYLFDCPEDIVN